GTTFTVNSNADTGSSGTLRWAINQANSTSGDDTIDFSLTYPATITLTSALPVISSNVIVEGPGVGDLAVSGDDLYQVFKVSSGTVSIKDLSIVHGLSKGADGAPKPDLASGGGGGGAAGFGAGLHISGGSVEVSRLAFEDNVAEGGVGGAS